MRTSTRMLAAAGLLAAVAGLAGCGDEPVPAPAPATPTLTVPASTGAGSDGLTVRYLDRDGSVRTVPVEQLPR